MNELKPIERVEITCQQCGQKAMQYPRNKKQKGVCSENCRQLRNRAVNQANAKERAAQAEKAGQ